MIPFGPNASRAEITAFLAAQGASAALPPPPPAPPELYTPRDVWAAAAEWDANCGPTALAALLGRPVMSLRDAFPWFPRKAWCSPSQMVDAIHAAKSDAIVDRERPIHGQRSTAAALPGYGLATIQIDGPWCQLTDSRVAYRYTHLVASQRVAGDLWIYDVNAGPDERPGAWAPFAWWAEHVIPALVNARKRATGWFVKVAIEVRR